MHVDAESPLGFNAGSGGLKTVFTGHKSQFVHLDKQERERERENASPIKGDFNALEN